MVNLKEVQAWDLVKELKSRGYYTELLFGLYDVEAQLDNINSDREEEDHIKLEEEDKFEIINNCFNNDYYSGRMNEDVEEYILDNYEKK